MSDLKSRVEHANTCLKLLKEYGKKGKGKLPRALSAYQALDAHPYRDELIKLYGMPGHKSGSVFSAAQHISKGLMFLERFGLVSFLYVTSKGTSFVVAGETVTPGYGVFAYYQLTSAGMNCDHLEITDACNVVLIDVDGKALQVFKPQDEEREEVE